MWGNPMFDLKDAKGVMMELDECRKAHGDSYIRINAFDSTRGWETVMMSFIVNRPKSEPGFRTWRMEPTAGISAIRMSWSADGMAGPGGRLPPGPPESIWKTEKGRWTAIWARSWRPWT